MHAFRPRTVLDSHGDAQKLKCVIDLFSLELEAVLGVLPSMECLGPVPEPTITTAREYMVETSIGSAVEEPDSEVNYERAMADFVIQYAKPKLVGHVQRFSQIDLGGATTFNENGSSDAAAHAVGALALLAETSAFGLSYRPYVNRYSLVDGALTPNTSLDTPVIEPCYLPDAICVATLTTEALQNNVPIGSSSTLAGQCTKCTSRLFSEVWDTWQ